MSLFSGSNPLPLPMPMQVHSPAGAPPPRPNSVFPGLGLPSWPPVASPPSQDPSRGRHPLHQSSYYDDDYVNALSFGLLATAILISMFLVMAVFERFLRPAEPPRVDRPDVESGKPRCFPSPKMKVYDSGVSVLMPGDEVPSFIAHPAPIPCPPGLNPYPIQQHSSSNSRSASNHSC